MSSESFFRALGARIEAEFDGLNDLDAALGDGDHGTTMLRGITRANLAEQGKRTKAFMRASGGASGTLFGLILHEIELHLDNGAPLSEGLARAEARIRDLGRVAPGDKSMIDALSPAVSALQAGGSIGDAAAAAARGREATRALTARRGRAQYVEGGGKGHLDPGAVSVALILQVLAQGTAP